MLSHPKRAAAKLIALLKPRHDTQLKTRPAPKQVLSCCQRGCQVTRFTAQIRNFRKKTERKAEAIFKQSTQEVFAIAQTPKAAGGRMPVLDGILRNSLEARLNGSTVMTGPASYELAIAGFELGDVIEGGWTVAYARRMELGFVGTDAAGRSYNQSGNFFAKNAVLQWVNIVNKNAALVRNL